jgi:hypothetical protein
VIRRPKEPDELFPWEFIETGVKREYLWEEFKAGLAARITGPCVSGECTRCGVCPG